MTQRQYEDLCKIFEKKLTEKDLKKMRMGKVDGKYDEELAHDMTLYQIEQRRRSESVL